MLHTPLAATEMVEQNLAHDSPSETGPPAERGIDVGDTDDAFTHQMVDLPGQGGLQPVGNMAGHLLVQADSSLPEACIELDGTLDRLLGRLRSADNLDKRDQVRRVEGMGDNAAFRVKRASGLDFAHGQAR